MQNQASISNVQATGFINGNAFLDDKSYAHKSVIPSNLVSILQMSLMLSTCNMQTENRQ